jgi:hypothetical protein
MVENMKKIVRSFLEKTVNYIQVNLLGKKAFLYTSENNPELIEAVTREMQGHDAHLILSRIEDTNKLLLNLEKALYHLAARQHDMAKEQKELERVMNSTATLVEEIANSIDNAEILPDSDDEFLTDAWDTKNSSSSPNN